MKIAVVGAGVAGLGAAWALARRRGTQVTLIEAGSYPGGHANTVEVEMAGRTIAVDTGFIVYNEVNYPNLVQLFGHLGVPTEASDMSFSASLEDGGFEYAGSLGGFFAQRRNLLRPRNWRMIRDLLRFYREAPGLLESRPGEPPCAVSWHAATLGDYLEQAGYSEGFARDHLLPMAGAIWSATPAEILAFPLGSFLRFFHNHGLFNLGARPAWRTVTGGSREYVRRLLEDADLRLCLQRPLAALERRPDGIHLTDAKGEKERFDQVVLATHANQALAILGESASDAERRLLSCFRTSENLAILHSDERLMPRRRAVWSSWNVLSGAAQHPGGGVCVSYWMNRLQNLETPRPLIVTLNPGREPEPALEHRRFLYHHPLFDQAAIAAQQELSEIQGRDGVWFCGAWCGYGFHEDGLRAGLTVAERLGAPAPWAEREQPPLPLAVAAE